MLADPLATYRVQLHAGFTFDDARHIVGYLADLGVSHMYCSPYLQAAAGSTHGYDVVDPARVSVELGGRAGLHRLREALHQHGLGHVVDIVPNHMAVAGRANPWWWDVLENGPSSRYASYFDIDWDRLEPKRAATVLVPILADHYGRVLEAGALTLDRDGGAFVIRYHDHALPVSPRTLDAVLGPAAEATGSDEVAFLARAHARLPAATVTEQAAVEERHRDKEILRTQLARLCGREPKVNEAIDAEVEAINADHDRLDALLARQNFRLSFWRTAGRELDYRRFFDVNTLVALRVEDERVFDDTHRMIASLVADGTVDGVRVDHIDGLLDPVGYLGRLDKQVRAEYTIVEKILEPGERLRDEWPVAGTTGYDFLNHANRLTVDPSAEAQMTEIYGGFTGLTASWDDVVIAAKAQVLNELLAADVERLSAIFARVCERQRRYRDVTRDELRDALRGVAAGFRVYRTYVRPGDVVAPGDRAIIERAVRDATDRSPQLDAELLVFLGRILALEIGGPDGIDLALRFQQLTGPLMAKAVEDTAFYRYLRLTSLNEVGGDPGLFGSTPAAFHEAMTEVATRWPAAMLTLSTHDTKRSADVRARIAVLSEVPTAWAEATQRWADRNDRHRVGDWPDPNTEYLIYQTLVGTWPISEERLGAYVAKATREAKVHTSWTDPDPAYDDALAAFVRGILADQTFVADLDAFLARERIVEAGRISSLAQTTLLLSCPGVPDLYQGSESSDLSLVDPDNRRPVDHVALARELASLAAAEQRGPLTKLGLVRALLHARRRGAGLRPGASYAPLEVEGSDGALAYLRGDDVAVVVATRGRRVLHGWASASVALPTGHWRSALTGQAFDGGVQPVAALVGADGVAVIERV